MTIFTVGHSTRSIEDFISLLKANGIDTLVDVRTIPRSRHNPQFNADALPASLAVSGISYVHLAELGGLRHTRKDSANTGWRNSSFRGFADYMQTDEFKTGLDRLLDLARLRTVAIMCAEAVPWRCHRSLIADALIARGVVAREIIGTNSVRDHALTGWAKIDGDKICYPPKQEDKVSKEREVTMNKSNVRGKKAAITGIDMRSVNAIRFLSIDAIQKANSGHPGLPMGDAPMAYSLWTKFLRHNPGNPHWFDRDRFVLSAGHGSMLLYSLLYLTGYEVSLEQIQNFRQWGSITPGHPEYGLTPGVEATTGPLGQGFANGVGMAIAEKNLAARFNKPGFKIVDHYTYAIVSDGDLMEGVASEAASLAGHLKLGKLIYLYDDNRITLSAATDIAFTEDRAKRFEAYGWHTQTVEDGNDLAEIGAAIKKAQAEKEKPSIILVRTHIGYGSPELHDTYRVHGAPLGEDEVKATKEALDWPLDPPFYVPQDVLANFRKAVDRGKEMESKWNSLVEKYSDAYPDLARDLREAVQGKLPDGWDDGIPSFPSDPKGMATRVASGKIIAAIQPKVPSLIGGSGDLDPSTHTTLKALGDFENPKGRSRDEQGSAGGGWDYAGRNIHFGVREHAMGAIANGIALHGGLMPFVATFLVFSDYMRPPIRLAALMKSHVIFVFTHDSIGLGEDGPTHQPVEQLAALRAIPNLTVIRPCDANETAVAWKLAVQTNDRPVALVLTRQNVPTLDRSKYAAADGLRKGAYVMYDYSTGKPDIILMASGSEVNLVVEAAGLLEKDGIHARIVSMPSWKLFNDQTKEYRDSVLPPEVGNRLAVEAGSTMGWHRYVGMLGEVIGMERFGASAPGGVVMREFGFTAENVAERARRIVRRTADQHTNLTA